MEQFLLDFMHCQRKEQYFSQPLRRAGCKTLVPILRRLMSSGCLREGLNTGGILSGFYDKHKLHKLRISYKWKTHLMEQFFALFSNNLLNVNRESSNTKTFHNFFYFTRE